MVFPYNRLIEYDPLPQEHVFSHKRYFQNGYIHKNFLSSKLKQVPISEVELPQFFFNFFLKISRPMFTHQSPFLSRLLSKAIDSQFIITGSFFKLNTQHTLSSNV